MSQCWRCRKIMTEDDEKQVRRPIGTILRKHFAIGTTTLRDVHGRSVGQTCAGGK